MCQVDPVELSNLTNELLELVVLDFDQEAVVFAEIGKYGLRVKKEYRDLRDKIYSLLNNNLNGEQ